MQAKVMAVFFMVVAAASAIDPRVRADVPFEFKVAGATLPAGEYEIRPVVSQGSARAYEIRNTETRAAALFVPFAKRQSNSGLQQPALDFRCAEASCELVALTHTSMSYRMILYAATKPAGPTTRTVQVALSPAPRKS